MGLVCSLDDLEVSHQLLDPPVCVGGGGGGGDKSRSGDEGVAGKGVNKAFKMTGPEGMGVVYWRS